MTSLKQANTINTARRILFSVGAIVLAGALLSTEAQAQAAPVKNKVVFQVSDNDPGKWGLTLNNATNVQKDMGAETTDLEIVVYGPGIGMLKSDSPVAQRIAAALKAGVKVVACENTLAAQKLTHADMLANIGYVPAGVVELMQKQQQGYAYIRP
jgi:intracellular sulfur oxidation DsrE/DsrF family protein